MNSRSIGVAIAAVTLLNSGPVQSGFAPFSFTAVRDYRPVNDLKAFKAGLVVTVTPAALAQSPLSRGTVRGDVSIDVSVQKYVDPNSQTQTVLQQCDALVLLVEQINKALENGLTLADAPIDCAWIGTESDPLFSRELLQLHSLFSGGACFTFLTRRTR